MKRNAVFTVDFQKAIMYVCEFIDILPQVLDFIYENVIKQKDNGSISNIPVAKCPF